MRLAEIKKEEYEFERDVVKTSGTGRPNAEKVAKYLEDKLRTKVDQTTWNIQ